MVTPRWLDENENRAWRSLMTLQDGLSEFLDRQLRTRHGISTADYQVLAHLSETANGRARSMALGHLMRWEKSRLSQHVARMEKRGLVRREPCEEDQRGTVLIITDHGRSLVEAAAPDHVADVRDAMIDHLTPEQLEVLTEIGDQVRARLTELTQKSS